MPSRYISDAVKFGVLAHVVTSLTAQCSTISSRTTEARVAFRAMVLRRSASARNIRDSSGLSSTMSL